MRVITFFCKLILLLYLTVKLEFKKRVGFIKDANKKKVTYRQVFDAKNKRWIACLAIVQKGDRFVADEPERKSHPIWWTRHVNDFGIGYAFCTRKFMLTFLSKRGE